VIALAHKKTSSIYRHNFYFLPPQNLQVVVRMSSSSFPWRKAVLTLSFSNSMFGVAKGQQNAYGGVLNYWKEYLVVSYSFLLLVAFSY